MLVRGRLNAQVVKLVDTPVLGTGAYGVEVRVLSWAPYRIEVLQRLEQTFFVVA